MTRMKESGIEWIGQIPEEWEVIKVKFFTYMKGRIGWQGLKADEFIEEGPYLVTGTDFKNGRVNWDTAYHISQKRYEQAPEIQLKQGDLLVTKDGTVGKLALIDELPDSASLNSHLLVLRPLLNRYDNHFLYYVLSSLEFKNYFQKVSIGSTMDSLSQEKMGEFIFAIPNINEQNSISRYLDKKTAQLDKAKALLEEQIQKLKDYRSSLIYETVTKGLDKTVPMKDSSIDWIGEVPEGWGVKRLKYLVEISTGTSNTQDRTVESEGYPFFVRSQNVEKLPTYTHDTEAILTAGDGVGVGKVFHYYKGKFTAHQRVYILSNFKNIESKFLFYYVSINLKNEVSLGEAKSTVDSIRMPMLSNFMVSIPSSTEQHNISNYLDCEIKRIQAMIEIKQNQIENIDKQRQTLIYDYVTGKRRV